MKRHLCFFICTVIITVVSCKKQLEPTVPVLTALYPKTIHFIRPPQGRAGTDLTHTFEYNNKNQLVKLIENDGRKVVKIVDFQYDQSGKLVSLRTAGLSYFFPYPKLDSSQTVTHQITYHPQQVRVLLLDSLKSQSLYYESSITFNSDNAITEWSVRSFGGKTTYIYDVDANLEVKAYSINNLRSNYFQKIALNTTYTKILSPFSIVPELRLFCLIPDQYSHISLENDIIMQNRYWGGPV